MRVNSPCYPFHSLGSNGSNTPHTQGVRWLHPVTLPPPVMNISTWPPPGLLPSPRRQHRPMPAVTRWRPVEPPAPPEDEQLGQWASEVALGVLV